jgi:hypothetical protein
MKFTLAATAAVILAAGLAAFPAESGAQVDQSATATTGSAGTMLRDELTERRLAKGKSKAAPAAPTSPGASSSPRPAVGSATPRPGLPHPSVPGIDYTVDVSSSFAYGHTGWHGSGLPGGLDAVLFAGPDKYTRVQAGYYTLSEYPIGFDTGNVPSYVLNGAIPVLGPLLGPGRQNCNVLGGLVGGAVPNCPANLEASQQNATVRNRIFTLGISKMIYLGGRFPIVITPEYVSRTASIGGGDDVFQVYNPDTFTAQPLHLRTAQTKSVLLTIPLVSSSKLFAAYTIGPQWLIHTAGLNQDNHPQFFQLLDVRYFANDKTTVFVQPSILQNYLPNDPYAQRIPTLIAGLSHKLVKPFFFQAYVAGGTPVNPPHGETGRVGIIDVTCLNLATCLSAPNPRTNTALQLGGLKASTIVLQLGIGTPSVIPF